MLLATFRRDGCLLCGEREHCCLTAHHLDPRTKRFAVGANVIRTSLSVRDIRAELAKCVPLCLCCHAKVTRGILRCPS